MSERTSVAVPASGSDRPTATGAVRWDPVSVLIWVLVVEHVYALVTPPYELGVEHAFHLSFGIAYAWLALRGRIRRGWHRVLLTVLLGIQFVGRFFVFAMITDTWIRVSLVPGALLTLLLVALLWRRNAPTVPRRPIN